MWGEVLCSSVDAGSVGQLFQSKDFSWQLLVNKRALPLDQRDSLRAQKNSRLDSKITHAIRTDVRPPTCTRTRNTLDHGWPESITARRSFPRKFFARCDTATNLVPAVLPPIGNPPSQEFAKHVKDDTYTALEQNSDYNASDSHDDSAQ